jgi:hypothetical protein
MLAKAASTLAIRRTSLNTLPAVLTGPVFSVVP